MEKKALKKTFVDTAFVIALVSDRDEFHERAVEYEHRPVLTTDCVLLEVSNSLARNHKKESIIIIEKLLSTEETEIVRLDENLFNKAFELYKTHADKIWGLVDCISFVVMKEHGITDALTCDKHFVQAGFRALMLDSVN